MQEDDRALSLAELAKLVADRFGSELADSPENLIGSEVDSLLLVEIVLVVEQLGVRTNAQPRAFQAALWDGVFLQYVVCSPRNPEPLGLVTAFNEDRGARHCEIGLAMTSVFHNRRMATEAAILFINHLCVEFDLRKVYIETLDITAERLGLARHELIHQERRKLEHERSAGNLHDTLLFAIYQPE